MKRNVFLAGLTMIVTMVLCINNVNAQNSWTQANACPGWNNPANFTSGNTQNYYMGEGGSVNSNKVAPNVMTGNTGINWSGSTYSASQLSGVTASGSCSSTGIPSHDHEFVILDTMSQATGAPRNRDPNTSNHLPFVPNYIFDTYDTTGRIVNTHLTKSIRIGDDCSAGGNSGAAALYYRMFPTTSNAMLFIYYACVVQAPGHGTSCDPVFIIRVMKQNENGTWAQVSDTLAYMVPSTPAAGQGYTISNGQYGNVIIESDYNTNGWHNVGSSSYSAVNYKDWVKVALNLGNLLYEPIRIEIMISDCCYNAHYAYAYVCGECREMDVKASGCPAGRSTTVTTLSAPRGMTHYEWSASRFGVSDPTTALNAGESNEHFSFRTLDSGTEADGHADYNVVPSDFRVYYRTVNGHDSVAVGLDSLGNRQTFRCRMTSALDPSKPFTTNLYVNVQNTKPTMAIDTISYCNGNVLTRNQSYVPGDNTGLVVDTATRWSFYSNPQCLGPADTVIIGDTALYHFNDTTLKGIVARTYTTDSTCWSEAQYTVRPRQNPNVGMQISNRVLCDADETTIIDTTNNSVYRLWTFMRETSNLSDSIVYYDTVIGYGEDNRSITRGFTHSNEPISLTVRNGLHYQNPYNIADTIWCQATATDGVAVFVHPELLVTGDTIVCQGSTTDAIVSAVGVDSCTYEWSRTYGTITGGIPAGDHLQVEPYDDTSIYYVRVTSPQGCVAWDSIHAYLVTPTLYIHPSDGRICPGQNATLTGGSADHYTWTASPNDPGLAGQDTASYIVVSPEVTTTYTMIGHGSNDCDATPLSKTVTIVPMPIPTITTSPDYVDSDEPTVTLRDVSPNSVSSSWLFNDGTRVNSTEVTHTFDEATGADSVYVELTTANELNCPVSRTFGIPVSLFTAWTPNIFTPNSSDKNNRFKIFTINNFEHFHIYIYNRQGMLVFESTDPQFEWDGTRMDGEPCPQGVYTFVYNYRKPGTPTLISNSGTITLVR